MHARQTKNFVYSSPFALKVLAAYLVAPIAALVAAPKVRLFQGVDFHPSAFNPLSAFTTNVATFTDYAEKTPILAVPVEMAGAGWAAGGSAEWLMTTDPTVTQNTVRGYYVVDGATLVGFEEWGVDDEVPMSTFGSRLLLELMLPFLFRQPVE